MLSTISIICIFLQIFTTGMLLSGIYAFLMRYLESKKQEDIFLSTIFLSFALYSSLIIISQTMYSMNIALTWMFMLHRIISVAMVVNALFIAGFIRARFQMKDEGISRILFRLFLVVCLVEIFMLIRSPLNLVENIKDIAIDPGVHFLSAVSPELFWVTLWGLLGFVYLLRAFSSKQEGEKNLFLISGISSMLLILSFSLNFYYATSGEANYLAASWGVNLLAVIGLLLGNVIEQGSEIAKRPFSYFRTRILYKLILIFILLIVILLEATTIATINIGQGALVKSIRSNYSEIAKAMAIRISYISDKEGKVDYATLEKIVREATFGKRYVYIVSSDGRLYAGPDPKEVGKSLSHLPSVAAVNAGKTGNEEYYSDFYIEGKDRAIISAFAPVPKYGYGVIVEIPKWEAYSQIRTVSTNTLIFVILGMVLTVSVGIFFARSIESSIKEVIAGTEAIRKGDLSRRIKIDSIDEIGQLADAFNQMTKELKDSQEHLISSEKMLALGTMAAGMAHEIKNPLVSLRTFTQLLPQRYEDEEFRKKFAAVVPTEIDKINRIAESLLRFGRPHKPELMPVNINEQLEEVLALLENEARKNNIRVSTKLSDIPKITADQGQLSQAFVNIILNAIQAMPNGGELTVKTDVGEVIKLGPIRKEKAKRAEEVRGETFEEAIPVPVVFIEISDTGTGIAEDNLKSIFDPFFTTKEATGTGMGLPITLRIIEEHQGSIKVRSQVGKGTTFIITLPQKMEKA